MEKPPQRRAAAAGGRAPGGKIPAGRAPDAARLREAALKHLARFAATELGLARVLARRVDRWARRAADEGQDSERIAAVIVQARADIAEIAARLTATGVVDDAAFAAGRARRLNQSGRSQRAIRAHLAARGVTPDTADSVLEAAPPDDLAAALGQLKRRRAGPFAAEPPDAAARMKAMGALARAGFSQDIAARAFGMDREEAEDRLIAARHG